MKRSRTSARRQRPRRSRASKDVNETSGVSDVFQRFLSFLLIFLVSSFLGVFVLFMQHQWRLSGQRAVLVVHHAEDEVRKPLSIVVHDPDQNQITLLELPREQQVPLWPTQLQYASDALVGYTQLEDLSWRKLQQYLTLEMGVVLDGVIWTDSSQKDFLDKKSVQKLAWQQLRPGYNSTLTYYDRWLWWRRVQAVNATDTQEFVSPLESESRKLNTVEYDRWANAQLQDPQVRRSRWSIAILNASGSQGAAQDLARALRVIGYEVRLLDTIELQETSELVFESAPPATVEGDWAKQRLQRLFSDFSQRNDDQLSQQKRSDTVIIIGTDLVQTDQ